MTDNWSLGRDATPLMLAIFRHEDALARQLIQSTSDVNARDEYGRTALHYLCRENRWYLIGERHEEVDDLLLELLTEGADVNAADNAGNTPLHLAAALGSTLLAEILVAAGAHVMCRNAIRETPTATATARNKSEMVTCLRDRMEVLSLGSGVLDLLPVSVYANPVNGKAITTARFGFIATWRMEP